MVFIQLTNKMDIAERRIYVRPSTIRALASSYSGVTFIYTNNSILEVEESIEKVTALLKKHGFLFQD